MILKSLIIKRLITMCFKNMWQQSICIVYNIAKRRFDLVMCQLELTRVELSLTRIIFRCFVQRDYLLCSTAFGARITHKI